jgi:hypothetical protein
MRKDVQMARADHGPPSRIRPSSGAIAAIRSAVEQLSMRIDILDRNLKDSPAEHLQRAWRISVT